MVLRPLDWCAHMSLCTVPFDYQEEFLDYEPSVVAATEESDGTLIVEWRARNDDSIVSGTSSTLTFPIDEEHAPLFPHF